MTRRQDVLRSLNHDDPGRVVVDFGATAVSGIHVSCVAALRKHYGFASRPVKVVEPYQMLGEVDEELREALGVDVVGVPARTTMFGFVNEGWREWRAPWGQVVLVSEHFVTSTAPNGDVLIHPQGDPDAPPSGRLPASGYFADSIVRQPPVDEEALDPADNLVEFGPVSDDELTYHQEQATALRTTGRAVVGGIGGLALGDIALVPAPFLKHPTGIRDVAEWYMSTALRPDYVHAVFARQTEIALSNLEQFHQAVDDLVDVLFVCGTDFGTQTSQFCSGATFDDLYAPYYRQLNDWVHAHTSWRTFKHSCGAIYPLLERFLDVGFDILNPVQCSATDMEPARLKAEFGDRVVFWGGGVDTQHTLPFGTPAEVRQQVLDRCRVFAPGGGFVFNTIHNVQARTPVANLVAMVDAVREFNGAG